MHACAQVRLSSAAVPDEKDDTTVVIGPPFYLEAKLAGLTIPIQDTQPGGGRKSILGEDQCPVATPILFLEASLQGSLAMYSLS